MAYLRLVVLTLLLSPIAFSSIALAWQEIPLTDVRTGETFTLGGFAGQTVFVEPMATWCSNCLRQLTNVADAKRQLEQAGRDDVVFVAISIETNLDPASLRAYSAEHGFDWRFAVATPELLRSLVGDFGRSITTPPATPHFVMFADGSVSEVTTGIEPAAALLEQIQ